jgi:choline dehydrogenase-like flavoprotein
VVVVGSGPAGASAALFLARAGVNVLLLEGGSRQAALGATVRLGGFTVFRWRRPLERRRHVAVTGDARAYFYEDLSPGGLSNQWSCAVPRFSPEDFEDAARAGHAFAWPIDYGDVAPWYARVEPLLHIAGAADSFEQLPAAAVRRPRSLAHEWTPVANEARSLGRTLVPMPYAYGADTTVTASGTAFNAFVRLIKPELVHGRIAVRYGAPVDRLEWCATDRRVSAVISRNAHTGEESRVPCRAVVLAAGAMGTPAVLLASKSADFPEGLGNRYGVLGRYLHDHPMARLVIDLRAPIPTHPPSYLTRRTIAHSSPLYAAACMQWSGTPLLLESLRRRHPGRLPWVGFNVFGTMAPESADHVQIDPRVCGFDGRPSLRVHIRHPPEAVVALEAARDDCLAALSKAGLDPHVRLWSVAPPGESVHYGGTCRMHASPTFGVVDRWSRLHDVRNVAVADSSVFTTGPEKNPVLTAMALAARAAVRLAEDLRTGDP